MGVFNLIQNWILESHYRGREIYQVRTAAFAEGQILNGSHSFSKSAKEETQAILLHSVCRAASAITLTLRHLFNDTWFQFLIV